MKFKQLHSNFQLPQRSSDAAGGLDILMPEDGRLKPGEKLMVPLGFAAAIPRGYIALILPRSGVGAKKGLELINTCGVIDADYRGEWLAAMQLKPNQETLNWAAGDRLLQIVVVPVADITPVLVDELDETSRGSGGFGSTGT